MTSTAVLFLLLGTTCCVINGQQGEQCVERLLDKMVTCFGEEGLEFETSSGQQDANNLIRETQTMDPAVQCKDKEAYKAAISCALEALQDCLVDVGMEGALPDVTKFQQGIDVVCRRQQEFDSQCMKSRYHDILTCAERTVNAVVYHSDKELSGDDADDIICLSADINYDCAKKHLASCANETLDIYLEQLDKYQVPAACAASSPGRQGRKTYILTNSALHTTPLPLSLIAFASVISIVVVVVVVGSPVM